MKVRLYPIILPLMLGLAACVAEYSNSEAPAQLRVDGDESRPELAFAPGSAYLWKTVAQMAYSTLRRAPFRAAIKPEPECAGV
jgi:hypothetical protein